jgi:hypothetical protein
MFSTGVFTIHRYEIKYQKYNEPIYLIPFGDIHRSSSMCHEEKWLEFLEWAKKKKNAYFLGMGDYDDLASGSNRDILANRNLYDTTKKTLEDTYLFHTKKLAKELSFMNGRIIGLMEGNHYAEFQNGTTTTQKLCELLNTTYLGVSAFIKLSLSISNKHDSSRSIDIWAHHGKGASRLIGGSLNRVQQMGESANADIYLMGHDHKKSVGLVTKLELTSTGKVMRLHHKKQLYARTGSFLKGYEDGKISYVADGCMSPTDLGVVKIELTPRRDCRNGEDITYTDLHASI